ncbi:MAG TPA: PEP/pyruvate-binding domain-containing protein [Polyangiaceae bacterium]|nr:PEP/pyruvate-binding domain-containing protein [Polyangiaceae bacterium]
MKAPNFSSVATSMHVVRLARWLPLLLLLIVCPLALQACAASGRQRPLPQKPDDPGFYDYSTPRVTSLAEFQQLAAVPPGVTERPAVAGAKFVITNFFDPARRKLHFLDGRYYQFHDEWAWFRLLNGQSVAGMDAMEPRSFRAPEDARRWAIAHEDELPEGLEVTDGRLYARHFYDLTLSEEERPLGAGSLIHVEARAQRPELWGFEVDYTDHAQVPELLVFFNELEKAIPEQARGRLNWFARSPEQLAVGQQLVARDPRWKGRVLTYADVSIPGETAIYTPGIVAGRLRSFRELSRLADADPEDILLLGALPEYLPQARGLVTAIPQTPLAHLNLLAKSRQIVNAYRGGVLEDPEVQDLVRSRAPVVLSAEGGSMRLHRLTEEQYQAWQALLHSEPPSVPSVSLKDVPYVVKLSEVEPAQLPRLSPLIGGKCVGMVHLLRSFGPGTAQNGKGTLAVDVPDRPLAITIRAYREHLAPLLPGLRALLADENFLKFKKLRFLALEGAEEFTRKFPSKKDRELAKSYENPQALGPIAAVVRQGGVQYMVRHAALPAAFKAELGKLLPQHFAAYSAEQGLRFRSSSTVEDIEGFNGAGLYDSSTGFLVPRKAVGKEPKRPSVADAVRKTWASYYSAEAFEERHQNHIDHLAADMGVLVHARFDDELEQSNGVFTFTLAPGIKELAVDAQPGAVSVTNPPTDRVVIPESSRVRKTGGAFTIERQSLSSLAKAGQQVVSDADLRELFSLAEGLTTAHLAQDNAGVPAAQQRRALVMDFEFRRVLAGWPALAKGQNPPRFVIKQARPLEPSPHVSAALRAAPIPHDVLSRARRIETRRCSGPGVELTALQVFTNPDALPDLGYSQRPLLAGLGVTLEKVTPRVFTHLEQRSAAVTPQGFAVELAPGFAFSRVEVSSGTAVFTRQGGAQTRLGVECREQLDYAEPRELLRSYLAVASGQ